MPTIQIQAVTSTRHGFSEAATAEASSEACAGVDATGVGFTAASPVACPVACPGTCCDAKASVAERTAETMARLEARRV
jgi:hypothetical protein